MKLVFITATGQRSGTNFLARLLELHPDITRPEGPWEWPGLHVSDLLHQYRDMLDKRFKKHRKNYPFDSNKIYHFLGSGFLNDFEEKSIDQNAKYLVHKYPATRGVDDFFKFFPNEKLLILMRNGRDNVNSFNKAANFGKGGFIKNYKTFIKSCVFWKRNVLRIEHIMNNSAEYKDQIMLVVYDELNKSTYKESERILNFLQLEIPNNWEAMLNGLGIKGSTHFKEGKPSDDLSTTNWKTEKKEENFNPNGRWRASWTIIEKTLYQLICGKADLIFEEIKANNK